MMKHPYVALIVGTFAAVTAATPVLANDPTGTARGATSKLPSGFVYIKDIAPGIIEDMRYATPRNFTGRPVNGYLANRCILARPVARALARVQASVASDGYAIKVYDCYRPARAVSAFVQWAAGRTGGDVTKFYYPRIARSRIIPLGYIAQRSSHSLGTAIDLTLVRSRAAKAAARGDSKPVRTAGSGKPGGSCIEPKARRAADTSIDMGTSWDCFDVMSHTHHRAITSEAKANRRRLLDAMHAEGFRNYRREWWHFSMSLRGFERPHNFPVK